MTVYALAQLTIHDPVAYGQYLDEFMHVFRQFDGTLLAVDPAPEVIEGQWIHEKIVLMSFPCKEAFDAWATSPQYQHIAADRLRGTSGVVLLARSTSLTGSLDGR